MAVGQTNVANLNARSRRRRWVLATTVVVILAAAGAGYLYLRGQQGAQPEAAAGPETVTVTPRPYRILVAGPGTLQPVRSFEVSADVNGRIVDMVELGDRITEGAEVASFERVAFERALLEAQLNLDKAQAQLESLQANLAESSGSLADSIADAERRVEDALLEWTNASEALALSTRLHTLGSESDEALADAQDSADQAQRALVSAQADLETLKASQQFRELANAQDVLNASIAVQQAEIDLARAQDDLDATTLTAPFTGVVAELSAQAGSNLSTNQPLFTLIEDSTLELITQIDETEIALVATGSGRRTEPRRAAGRRGRRAGHHHLAGRPDRAEYPRLRGHHRDRQRRPETAPGHDRRGGDHRARGRQHGDGAEPGGAIGPFAQLYPGPAGGW